jgi:hypothetical protein
MFLPKKKSECPIPIVVDFGSLSIKAGIYKKKKLDFEKKIN